MFTHFWSGQQISLFDGARAKKLPNEFIALLTCQKWAYILCTIEMAIFPDFFRLLCRWQDQVVPFKWRRKGGTKNIKSFVPTKFLRLFPLVEGLYVSLIKTCFLTGLEKSLPIWLFSSNEWALGRVMHEMSYFLPRKFRACPKGLITGPADGRTDRHTDERRRHQTRIQKSFKKEDSSRFVLNL